MQKRNCKYCIEKLVILFRISEKINIVSVCHKKLGNSFLKEILYAITPIFIYSINLINMISDNAFYTKESQFTYLNDLGNSLGLTTLFFLSYFLSGHFPRKFDEFLIYGVKKESECRTSCLYKKISKSKIFLFTLQLILFIIGTLSGYFFYNVVKVNNAYWVKKLSSFGKIYYCTVLGITWYQSFTLLFMASCAGIIIYRCIKTDQLIYIEENYNKNISIIKAFDILVCTFSYGLFYILGSILVILNDKIAVKYGMNNLFVNNVNAFILILIIFCIIVFEFIPLKELLKYMNYKKDILIARINRQIESEKDNIIKENLIDERNKLIAQNLITTSFSNKIMLILSIAIPLSGVIIQSIQLCMDFR